MSQIFLSYRRQDSLAITGRLYERLAQHFGKDSAFMDIDTIPPGVDFRQFLNDAVAAAAVVLIIIGDGWLDARDETGRRLDDPDDFVRIEAEAALTRGIPTIPILVGRAPMPRPTELPPSLRMITYLNAIAVDPGRDFSVHADRLIQHLEKHVGLKATGARQAQAGTSTDASVELARFAFIKDSDNPSDYRDFLARYPNGQMADLALQRLRSLEDEEWQRVQGYHDTQEIARFLERFPESTFAHAARTKLDTLREESRRWDLIRNSVSINDYQVFLETFAEGPHAREARQGLENARIIHRLGGHTESVSCLTLSKDATLLVSGGNDATVRIWDVRTGKCLHEFEHDRSRHHYTTDDGKSASYLTGRLLSVAISPNNDFVLSCAPDGANLWDLRTGTAQIKLPGYYFGGAFAPDGSLAAIYRPIEVIVLDLTNDKTLAAAEILHTAKADHIFGVVFANGNCLVGKCGWPGEHQLCSFVMPSRPQAGILGRFFGAKTVDGQIPPLVMSRLSLDGSRDTHETLMLAPSGQAVISRERDGASILWSLATGNPRIVWTQEKMDPLAFAEDGIGVLFYGDDGYNIRFPDSVRRLGVRQRPKVASLAQNICATADYSGVITLWNFA